MREPKICLGMMVKHEEQTLKKAIECCLPYVDHVLVSVDSESRDGTRSVAEEMSNTVNTHIFASKESPHGSFAKSRQSVIDAAKELGYEWLLQMDGHEYLSCENGKTLKQLIKDHPKVDAFSVGLIMGGTVVRQIRLHKLNGIINYKGDIHNYIVGVTNELFVSDIKIIHDRSEQPKEYVEERTIQRATMSEKILSENIKKNPNDSRSMFYLAQSYKETGKYKKAIEYLEMYLKVSKFIEERWNAYQYLYVCLRFLEKFEDATKIIKKGLIEQNRAEGHVFLGDEEYARKKYLKAIKHYQKAIVAPKPRNMVFCNQDYYTWFPHDKISMCHHHLKNYLEAIKAASYALQQGVIGENVLRIGKNISYWSQCLEE